jgi:hypothetical protein
MSVSVASQLRGRPVTTQPPPRKADPHTLSRTGTAAQPSVGRGCSSSLGAASAPPRPARAAG